MFNRREFMHLGGVAALGLLTASRLFPPNRVWAQRPPREFTYPLPVPNPKGLWGLLKPQGPLTMLAKEIPGLLPAGQAPMLAYQVEHGGAVLYNPTLILRQGQIFEAKLVNGLAEPTIIHWHGLDADWRQTGHPSYQIEPGESYPYRFPVTNRAATFFYHPHPHGLTAKQTYLGLAGFFLVQDDQEQTLNDTLDLEFGRTDLPLMIQDKRFDSTGWLQYAPNDDDVIMGYLGTEVLINGASRPFLEVSTRLYRFRLLNGSTARVYNLGLYRDGKPWPLTLIGVDGGLLSTPREISHCFLSPGERVDLLADFSKATPGQDFFFQNIPFDPMHREMDHSPGAAGHAHGPSLAEGSAYPILKLLLTKKESYSRKIPDKLNSSSPRPDQSGEKKTLKLSLNHHQRRWTINGLTYAMKDAPLVVDKRGVEVWEMVNADQSMPHPMHVHGYLFQVLSRRNSPDQVKGLAVDRFGRLPTDLGLKDTILVWPGETVETAIDFSSPDYPGEQLFLVHCHNLEHEDAGMMLNFKVKAIP